MNYANLKSLATISIAALMLNACAKKGEISEVTNSIPDLFGNSFLFLDDDGDGDVHGMFQE